MNDPRFARLRIYFKCQSQVQLWESKTTTRYAQKMTLLNTQSTTLEKRTNQNA
jgi:hypothetical protein